MRGRRELVEAPSIARSSSVAVAATAIVIVAAGAWLHFRGLSTIPGLNGDEAYYGVLALLEDPRAEAGISDAGTWFPPLIRAAISVAGTTAFALRAWPALFATLAPLLAYWVVARGHGVRAGILVAAPIIAHPALLVFARIGWDNSLAPLLIVILVVASRALFREPRALVPLVAGSVVAGLAARLHPTALTAAGAWCVCVVASQALAPRRSVVSAGSPAPAWLSIDTARLRAGAIRVAVAAVALLLAAFPVLPLLASFAGGGGAPSIVMAAPRPPADLAGLVTGGLAIEWVTGIRPFAGAAGWLLAASTAALAFIGIALGLRSRDPAERGSSLFCALAIALGVVALARTDMAAPGHVRHALALYPCVAWALGRAPELMARSRAVARSRALALALAAHVIAGAVVIAGLWGWQRAFWAPLQDDARAAELAFVPGRDRDSKQEMIERIALVHDLEAAVPSVALVAMNWDLYHAARFFSRRRYPVLRVDVHDVEEFEPRFRALAGSREEIFFLVYERTEGEAAPLARRLESLMERPVRAERETIADRLGRPLIALYRFAPREREANP